MPMNKYPGMDGLTVEYYHVFWDFLSPDLDTIWVKSLESRVLLLSCSTDYKVVVKAISLWLGSVLADVVHPDQTYTILDHTIFDNLYLVRDLLELRLMGLVLREPELQLVLSAHADNVLLVVQDPGHPVQVEACQAIYSVASSARINWVKNSDLVCTINPKKPLNQMVRF
ncbi:unnamed protein product [Caretta caretta]